MNLCHEKPNSMRFQVFHEVEPFSRFSMTGRNPVSNSSLINGMTTSTQPSQKYGNPR